MPRKNSTTRSTGDDITATRLNDFNEDFDDLYSNGSDHLRVYEAVSGTPLRIDITAGAYYIGSTVGMYAGGTDIVVTNAATNYVMIDNTGTITISTSARTAGLGRLATVVCSGGFVTSIILRNNMVFGGAALDMTALTEDTSPDEENDFLFSYDASAGLNKKVKPKNLDVRPFIEGVAGETLVVGEAVFTAISGLGGNITQATQTIDRSICSSTTNFSLGQSFTPSNGGILTQITIPLKKVGSPTGSLYVDIFNDQGSKLLYRSTTVQNVASLTTSYVDTNFAFPSLYIQAGNLYYIRISATTAVSVTNYIAVGAHTGNPYAGGECFGITDQNVWTGGSQDIKMTITIGGIPETAGRLYKTDADFEYKTRFTGIIRENASSGGSTKVDVNLTKNLSSLSIGFDYYLGNTPGTISTAPGTISKKIGKALSATELAVEYNPA